MSELVLYGSATLCMGFDHIGFIWFLITYLWYNSLLDPLGEKRKEGKKHIPSHFIYDSRFLKLLLHYIDRDVPHPLVNAQSGSLFPVSIY